GRSNLRRPVPGPDHRLCHRGGARMATPDVTPPVGWVAGHATGTPLAMVNESWRRLLPTHGGLVLSVSYSVRDEGYYVYQTERAIRWRGLRSTGAVPYLCKVR